MPGDFALPTLRRFDPATGDVTLVSDAEATDDELAQLEREHNVFLADVRAAYNARMAQLRIARNQRERGHDGCAFEDERHDVRRCTVHGGFIHEDFYSEAHGNGWGDAWDCAHDQGHACVTHCTNRERQTEGAA